MALTTLDPRTALIVVDLQKGLAGYPFLHPLAEVVGRTRALLDVFHRLDLPVVLVNVAGRAPGRTEQGPRGGGAFTDQDIDFLPELAPRPGDIVVTKRAWGAFASTDLETRLKGLGVTQVVVTGVATGTGVEATARQAYEAGFNVTLPLDAMTDGRPEAHDYSTRTVFPRLGETGTSQDAIDLLTLRRV